MIDDVNLIHKIIYIYNKRETRFHHFFKEKYDKLYHIVVRCKKNIKSRCTHHRKQIK